MSNVLKKIEIGNPLINLEMWNLYDEYQTITTDEELAAFYHKCLDILEVFQMCNRNMPVFLSSIYSMIAFSTNVDANPLYLLMQKTLISDENRNSKH